jgi:uncharacterized protein (TIGR02266 family)
MKPPLLRERRRYKRAPLRIIVRVKTEAGSQRYYSKNISPGGVFLLSDAPLAEETEVELEMELPGMSAPVKVGGEVVWNRRQEPRGFAVKFIDISDITREFIRWSVRQFRRAEGESE